MIALCSILVLQWFVVEVAAASNLEVIPQQPQPTNNVTNIKQAANGRVGNPYNLTLATENDHLNPGLIFYNYTVLPDGLKLNGSTLSGILYRYGRYRIGIAVGDPKTNQSALNVLEMVVYGMEIVVEGIIDFYPYIPFKLPLKVTGGYGTLSFKITEVDWASVKGDYVVGTTPFPGDFHFKIKVTDEKGNEATKLVNMTVIWPLMTLEPMKPLLVWNKTPTCSFTVTGGQEPYNFTNYFGLPACIVAKNNTLTLVKACDPYTYSTYVSIVDANNVLNRFFVDITVQIDPSTATPTLSSPVYSKALNPANSVKLLYAFPLRPKKDQTSQNDPPGIFVSHIRQQTAQNVCASSQTIKFMTGIGVIVAVSTVFNQYTLHNQIVLAIQPCTNKRTLSANHALEVGDYVEWTGVTDIYNPTLQLVVKLVELVPPYNIRP